MIRFQPFIKIDGDIDRRYEFIVLSNSDKKSILERKRRHVELKFNPADDLVSMNCECEGFNIAYKKEKPCQCIKDCLKILKGFGEIDGHDL